MNRRGFLAACCGGAAAIFCAGMVRKPVPAPGTTESLEQLIDSDPNRELIWEMLDCGYGAFYDGKHWQLGGEKAFCGRSDVWYRRRTRDGYRWVQGGRV